MKLLLHVCCAPCSIYPLSTLKEAGFEVSLLFFNPNIHPFFEWEKRKQAVEEYAKKTETRLIVFPHYDITEFLREMVFREKDRCRICYHLRLKKTAETAKNGGFDCFSSTLLGSLQQKHELIKDMAEAIARDYNLKFYYQDFRTGVKKNIEVSKKLNLYRQQYCGCIYSEEQRFRPKY